jgi:hypothetical protein
VQFGQREALIEMVEVQYGHSFVVGSAEAGSGFRFRLLMPFL